MNNNETEKGNPGQALVYAKPPPSKPQELTQIISSNSKNHHRKVWV